MRLGPCTVLLASATALQAASAAGPASGTWKFEVRLDDWPIGTHSFKLAGDARQRKLRSEADFSVKFIGRTAYRYHPGMLAQSPLPNPHSGKSEAVQVRALGNAQIEWRGATVTARHYRIDGSEQPLELWYPADGDWLRLESAVRGRTLTYLRQ